MNSNMLKNGDSAYKENLLTLKNREKLSLTGVEDVVAFDEKAIEIITDDGILSVEGENIKIEKLDIERKEMSLSGRISGLFYSDKKPGKAKGLFGKNVGKESYKK